MALDEPLKHLPEPSQDSAGPAFFPYFIFFVFQDRCTWHARLHGKKLYLSMLLLLSFGIKMVEWCKSKILLDSYAFFELTDNIYCCYKPFLVTITKKTM